MTEERLLQYASIGIKKVRDAVWDKAIDKASFELFDLHNRLVRESIALDEKISQFKGKHKELDIFPIPKWEKSTVKSAIPETWEGYLSKLEEEENEINTYLMEHGK